LVGAAVAPQAPAIAAPPTAVSTPSRARRLRCFGLWSCMPLDYGARGRANRLPSTRHRTSQNGRIRDNATTPQRPTPINTQLRNSSLLLVLFSTCEFWSWSLGVTWMLGVVALPSSRAPEAKRSARGDGARGLPAGGSTARWESCRRSDARSCGAPRDDAIADRLRIRAPRR